jgi:hypothetical protein
VLLLFVVCAVYNAIWFFRELGVSGGYSFEEVRLVMEFSLGMRGPVMGDGRAGG